jgi:hypothetical protein
MLRALIAILLVFMLIGLLPVWPYSAGWGYGYYPSGGLLVLLIVLAVVFSDRRSRLV